MPNRQDNDTVSELADFKFALEASSIVAITDQRGRITYANDKFCRLSKYSWEELIGQDHRIINSGYHSKEFFKDLWRTIGKDRKSTRLNSSHVAISYAVFCLKKKNTDNQPA